MEQKHSNVGGVYFCLAYLLWRCGERMGALQKRRELKPLVENE